MTELLSEVVRRVGERGFRSVTEFADQYPRHTLVELAQELSGVTGIQLELCLREEALERNAVATFARSYLVRVLRWMIPEGWGQGRRAEPDTVMAHVHWMTGLGEPAELDADEAFRRLRELEPPPGWLPSGPDDPILVQAFDGLHFGDDRA